MKDNNFEIISSAKEKVRDAVHHIQPEEIPLYYLTFYTNHIKGSLDRWLERFDIPKSGNRGIDNIHIKTKLMADVIDVRLMEFLKEKANVYINRWMTMRDSEADADNSVLHIKSIQPLASAESTKEVVNHKWPKPNEIFNFSSIKTLLNNVASDKARIVGLGWEPVFCTLHLLFGMEEAMIKMHTNPAVIQAAVEKIENYLMEGIQQLIIHSKGMAEFVWYGDDFAGQTGMILSPKYWRKYLKPTYKKVFELIKMSGCNVWFHSCGSFRPVMPDLIDIGLDVWETVQTHLPGNEPEELKREYGKDITFAGGINTQYTLTNGTPEEVRQEVRTMVKVLGKGGGYICGPDHTVLPNVPMENIEALIDEVKKL
jgi:uroporphyrinogen decarboxylase